MSDKKVKRRDFIITTSYALGAVGVGAAVWPLIDQMNPDASVKALASTEVDVSSVEPGQSITVLWRGKPVFIKRRTQEEIDKARAVDIKNLKHPEKDEDRAKNPEWLVMLGVCTHLGCVPLDQKGYMINFLDKFLKRTNNLNDVSKKLMKIQELLNIKRLIVL